MRPGCHKSMYNIKKFKIVMLSINLLMFCCREIQFFQQKRRYEIFSLFMENQDEGKNTFQSQVKCQLSNLIHKYFIKNDSK